MKKSNTDFMSRDRTFNYYTNQERKIKQNKVTKYIP